MEKAAISEIKNHLSAYLKKVQEGESVLILDHNRPVARLERVEGQDYLEERLGRLELRGLLRRSTKPVPMELLRAPPPEPKRSFLQVLLDERLQGM